MYSAIKHRGTPLHRLARQGIAVEREPRQVEIFRLELTAWEPPYLALEVECSPGTYVRSLAHDLGQELACGAHLTGLIRLSSGGFQHEDSVSLEEFAQAASEDRWFDLLHPIDAALTHFPDLHLDAREARRICSGQAIDPIQPPPLEDDGESVQMARAYGPDHTFLALVRYDGDLGVWRPHKVFHTLER
jgi:tRNA pseudouridine55 synthase